MKKQKTIIEQRIEERRGDPEYAKAYDAVESAYNAILRSEVPPGDQSARVWHDTEKKLLKEFGW